MFAVIYRGYIFPDLEEEYEKLWAEIASFFVEHRGALGSCLHKTETGEYIAYSRWPSREVRDNSWGDDRQSDMPARIEEVIGKIKDCRDLSKPHDEICMDVVDDLLLTR